MVKELQVVVDKLNHRPRKYLDYRTSFEVFYNEDTPPKILCLLQFAVETAICQQTLAQYA